MESSIEKTQFEKLQERIEYDVNIFGSPDVYKKVLGRLLEDSNFVGLSIKYPYQDYSNMTLPKKHNNWQIRCCEEIYNSIGTIGIKSYAENGLSWTRDSGYISYELRNEIEPTVGYIIPNVEEVEE